MRICLSTKVDTFWNNHKDGPMDSDFKENNHHDDAEDDDHVFGKHMGDDGLLHGEHVAHHDVPACDGKPVNNNVKYCVINFTNAVKGTHEMLSSSCQCIASFTFPGPPHT